MRTSSSTETAKTLRVRQLLHLGRPQDRTGLTGVRAALCHLPSIELENVRSSPHQTEPPKRFTEPSLVKTLEKTGVGRPSTYANIINTLLERVYVTLNKKNLMVTELGLKVDEFLSKVVPDVIDPGFTAQLEKNLDEIASGQLNWE